MKISVISPRNKQGRTTVSLILAQALAYTTKFEILVTYQGDDSAMPKALGVMEMTEDKTRSTSQVVKLIQSGGFSISELRDYMINIDNQLMFLNTATELTTVKDSVTLVNYMTNLEDYSMIQIVDIDTELYEDSTQELLSNSDLVLVVVDQTRASADQLKVIRETDVFPDPDKVCYIFNRFDPVIMSHRDTSKMYGIRQKRTVKLNYNPHIVKATNQGKIDTLVRLVEKKDIKLVDLETDMFEMAKFVGAHIGFAVKWRNDE